MVKLAAVEEESQFQEVTDGGVIGLNTHDASTLDLDSYLQRVDDRTGFLGRVLFAHAQSAVISRARKRDLPDSVAGLIETAFAEPAFELLIQASEGNPRDAIILAAHAAEVARDKPITPGHIRRAAMRMMYEDKDAEPSRESDVWPWLRDVVTKRQSRCFYVADVAGRIPSLLRTAYSARLVHRGPTGIRNPGLLESLDLWHVDYGFALLLSGASATDQSSPPIVVPPVLPYTELAEAPVIRQREWSHTSAWKPLDADVTTPLREPGPPAWVVAKRAELSADRDFVIIDLGIEVRAVALDKTPLSVGRAVSNDICIEHQSVSRTHAELVRAASVWRVVDKASTNGIYVNGALREWHELADHDVFRCGVVPVYFVSGARATA